MATTQETPKVEGNSMFWLAAFVVAVAIIWWWLNREETKAPSELLDKAEDRLRQAQRNLEQAAQKASEALAQSEQAAQEHTQHSPTPDAASAQTSAPPAPETANIPTVYDDLTRISGIGEAFQAILYAAGITTYRQLAALSEEELLAIIRAGGGRKSASMATWAAQAQALLDSEG